MEIGLLTFSCFTLGTTGWFIKKDNDMRELFEKIEKSRVLDMEHIPGTDGIPMNKPICMRGRIEGEQRSCVIENDKSAIVSMVLPSFDDSEEDYPHYEVEIGRNMVESAGSDGKNPCYLYNENGGLMLLDFPETGLKFHNITMREYDDVDVADLDQNFVYKGFWEKWNLFKKRKYTTKEMILRDRERYIFMGDMTPYNGQIFNPKGARHVLKLFFVTGDRKEGALKYVDNLIGYYSKRSKILFGFSLGLSSCVLGYKKLIKPNI